jgi:hypothetical protein
MKKYVIRKSLLAIVFLAIFFSCFFAISKNTVSASVGSITMENYYPNDGETYQVIDHFTEQILSINTNSTVSVSIDGGTPIPMIYKGLISEVAEEDLVARDWYTWETTISPLTTPGLHSFQFLGKYYVWQETDQYWAEFNYSSDIRSFIIENPAILSASNNSSNFASKEISLATPEAIALKMSQPSVNNTESKSGNLKGPDPAVAFLVGTICAIAGAVLIGAIVVIQVFSRRKIGLNQNIDPSQ